MSHINVFGKTAAQPARSLQQQRAPLATRGMAHKIDAIESAMTAEFDLTPLPPPRPSPAPDDAMQRETVLEEAALLYASGHEDVARALMFDVCSSGSASPISWQMLLELCQLGEQEKQFEQFAMGYARRFETSPLSWRKLRADSGGAALPVPVPLLLPLLLPPPPGPLSFASSAAGRLA